MKKHSLFSGFLIAIVILFCGTETTLHAQKCGDKQQDPNAGLVAQAIPNTNVRGLKVGGASGNKKLQKGLVAWYQLNGDGVDASGNRNNGRVIKGVQATEDRFGRECAAMQFNGKDGFIRVPHSKSLGAPQDAVTVTAWFKLSQRKEPIKWVTICCKGDLPEEMDNSPQYRCQSTSVTASLNTAFTEEIEHPLEYNGWYFYAMTYDKNYVTVYINNIEYWRYPYSDNLSYNELPLEIGRDVPGNLEYHYGALDDIRIYNRALDKQEILGVFQDESDVPGPCKQPDELLSEEEEEETPPSLIVPFKAPKKQPTPPKKPAPPKTPKKVAKKKTSTPKPPVVVTTPKQKPTPPPVPKPVTTRELPKPVVTTPKPVPTIGGEVVTTPRQPDPKLNPPKVVLDTLAIPEVRSLPKTPSNLDNRNVKYQKTLRMSSPYVSLFIYDHEIEDSDTVSIFFNGEWIVEGYEIKNPNRETNRYRLKLKPNAENFIIVKAWNLGTRPPNTLTMEISDGINKKKVFNIKSDLKTNGGVRLFYNE